MPGEGTSADAGRLQDLLKRAGVSDRAVCACKLFSASGDACRLPVAQKEGGEDMAVCWRCRYMLAVTCSDLPPGCKQPLDAPVVNGESEEQRMSRVLQAALVSEVHTCQQTMFTPDGAVCGRPAVLTPNKDGTFTPSTSCWYCKRIEAMAT